MPFLPQTVAAAAGRGRLGAAAQAPAEATAGRFRWRAARWRRPVAAAAAVAAAVVAVVAAAVAPAAAAGRNLDLPDGEVIIESVNFGDSVLLVLRGGGADGDAPPTPPAAGKWLVEASLLALPTPPPDPAAARYPPVDAPRLALMAAEAPPGGAAPDSPRLRDEGTEPLLGGSKAGKSRQCTANELCVDRATVADAGALLRRSAAASVVVQVGDDAATAPPVVVLTLLAPPMPRGERAQPTVAEATLRFRARRLANASEAACVTPWAVDGVAPPGFNGTREGALATPGPDVLCSSAGACAPTGCECNGTAAGPYCSATVTPLGADERAVNVSLAPGTSRYYSVVVSNARTSSPRSRLLISLDFLAPQPANASGRGNCALQSAYRSPLDAPPSMSLRYLPAAALPSTATLVQLAGHLWRTTTKLVRLTPDVRGGYRTGATVLLSVDHMGGRAASSSCPPVDAVTGRAAAKLDVAECSGSDCPSIGGLERLVWTALMASSFLLAVSAAAFLWHRWLSGGRASAPTARHDRLSAEEVDRMLPVFSYSEAGAAEAVRSAAAAAAASEAAAAVAAARAEAQGGGWGVAALRRRLRRLMDDDEDCVDPEEPPVQPGAAAAGVAAAGGGGAAATAAAADGDNRSRGAAASVTAAANDTRSSSSSDGTSGSDATDVADGAPTPAHGAPATTPSACAVCLSAFEAGEPTRALPCGHLFHAACITPWVTSNASCPTCRRPVRIEALSDRPTLRAAVGAAVGSVLRPGGGASRTPGRPRGGASAETENRGWRAWRRRARRRARRRRARARAAAEAAAIPTAEAAADPTAEAAVAAGAG